MIPKQPYSIYIASCDKSGGICRYLINKHGKLTFVEKTDLDRPMYLAVENNKMYVLLRQPFEKSNESGMVSFDIDEYGSLINSSEILTTHGMVACHLAVENGQVYCVNYLSGSVVKMPDKVATHVGKSIHPTRQAEPHAHYVCAAPDGYILAVDLGMDRIITYSKDLDQVYEASVPKGHGARHLVFSKDNKYVFCANELKSSVSAFLYDRGRLEIMNTYPTLPAGFCGDSAAAAIRISDDGKYLYISNRGHNSIACFEIIKGELMSIAIESCKGDSPRDFNIIGDYLISANENSNTVTVFKMENGKMCDMADEIKLSKALCIVLGLGKQ
jgi:6-phosphogluconolactonase